MVRTECIKLNKYKNYFLLMKFLVVLFILSSCASPLDAVLFKSQGTSKIFNITQEKAWDTTLLVLQSIEAQDIIIDKNQKYVAAAKSNSRFAIWIEPSNNSKTIITVYAMRMLPTNIFLAFNEEDFFNKFQMMYGLGNK
jgi:hypothetical protein